MPINVATSKMVRFRLNVRFQAPNRLTPAGWPDLSAAGNLSISDAASAMKPKRVLTMNMARKSVQDKSHSATTGEIDHPMTKKTLTRPSPFAR